MTRRFDLSSPALALVAALLAIMIVLPMGWLVVYAFATKDGQATLGNFVTLFTDPSFVDPLLATLVLSVSVSGICCLVAAPMGWLVARTDMPLARTVRTNLPEGIIAEPLGALQNRYADIDIGSYPAFRNGRPSVSLVLRGTDAARLETAAAELVRTIKGMNGEAEEFVQ